MRETDGTLRQPPLEGEARVRTLLLVDDEENILAAMRRLLRREGYAILSAADGERGLELLAEHPVDVIVSDQRMPGMTGVEFLRRAKTLRPETIRIVLSGYTELQSITAAVNEGAIYKFLTKPWEDEQLRAQIADAFYQKGLADENRRLAAAVRRARDELADANAQLQRLLAEREGRISRHEIALGVLHEVMEMLPWPFLGVDDEGLIVTMNAQAESLFAGHGMLLGLAVDTLLPAEAGALLGAERPQTLPVVVDGVAYQARCRPLSIASGARGRAIALIPEAIGHGR